MVHTFLFLLAVYGLANAIAVLKFGQLFFGKGYCPKPQESCPHKDHPKELRKCLGKIPFIGDLFYCPPCLAFWIGMAMSVWVMSPSAAFLNIAWKAMLVDGLAASASAYLLHVTAEKLSYGLDL